MDMGGRACCAPVMLRRDDWQVDDSIFIGGILGNNINVYLNFRFPLIIGLFPLASFHLPL